MNSILELFKNNLDGCKLKILVFGPSPNTTSADPKIQNLLSKRLEIQTHLRQLGHAADFPEEIVNLSASMPVLQNPWFQEMMLITAYDLVVILIESPGSNIELGFLSGKTEYAAKVQGFINKDYNQGLPYQACEVIKVLGGQFHDFTYPQDITECHLLTKIVNRVTELQLAKFLS